MKPTTSQHNRQDNKGKENTKEHKGQQGDNKENNKGTHTHRIRKDKTTRQQDNNREYTGHTRKGHSEVSGDSKLL